jgi:hypothetical protein
VESGDPSEDYVEVINVLLAVIGIAILFIGLWQIFVTLSSGSFRARGDRLISRNAHPIIFWSNFAALSFVSLIGATLITWAWLTTN